MFSDADAYDRFMGRYSTRLAGPFADFAEIASGQVALDVGCGPGALMTELVARLGAESVFGVDPSESFVEVAQVRHPGVEIRTGTAEDLPFESDKFDRTLAQLVVHFMSDPLAGIRQMRRVTRPNGLVAATVWDFSKGMGPLTVFWEEAIRLHPGAGGESRLAGVREEDLRQLFEAAGLSDIESTALSISFAHSTFEEWWDPFTLGVGPAGAFVAGLEEEQRTELEDACRRRLAHWPLEVNARAWAAKGVA